MPAASGKEGISDQVECEPGLEGQDIVGGGVWTTSQCGPHLRWQMDFTWKGSEAWSVGKDWRKVGVGSL